MLQLVFQLLVLPENSWPAVSTQYFSLRKFLSIAVANPVLHKWTHVGFLSGYNDFYGRIPWVYYLTPIHNSM